jgi:5'-nucleotidase
MLHQRPLILVCNDDGVFAPGIHALIDVVKEFGDIIVVAPDAPQSGMGHAVTISDTIKIANMSKEVDYLKYSCSGTPVDCVKIGVNRLAPRRPDLVVSGINHGSNSSINVIYSGTMSAAVEGAVMRIPSVGFSLCDYSYDADFEPSKKFIRHIVQTVLKTGLPKGVCLNVNIPAGKELKGIKVGRQAKAFWDEELDERTDPRGGTYFWLTGVFRVIDTDKDTDEAALADGYVSVVPVQYDLTAYEHLQTIKQQMEYVGETEKG